MMKDSSDFVWKYRRQDPKKLSAIQILQFSQDKWQKLFSFLIRPSLWMIEQRNN